MFKARSLNLVDFFVSLQKVVAPEGFSLPAAKLFSCVSLHAAKNVQSCARLKARSVIRKNFIHSVLFSALFTFEMLIDVNRSSFLIFNEPTTQLYGVANAVCEPV